MLHEQEVDAEPGDLTLLDPEWGQPERLAIRHEDAARVRLEGQHPGRDAVSAGAVASFADQRRVPQMQPVEIAHRQHRAAGMRRSRIGMSDDAEHGAGDDRGFLGKSGLPRKIAAAAPRR